MNEEKDLSINLRIRYGSKRYWKTIKMADTLGVPVNTKMFDKMLNKINDIEEYDLQQRELMIKHQRAAQEIKTKIITGESK